MRVDLNRALGCLRQRRQLRLHDALVHRDVVDAGARDALDEHAHPGWRFRHLPDDADGSNLVELVRPGLFDVARLEEGKDHPIAGERAIDRLD